MKKKSGDLNHCILSKQMFNYSDLKKTRVYQEAKEEGEQIGLQRQISMLQRMLTRKFGQLSPRTSSKISKLSAIQLENLADVIFELRNPVQIPSIVLQ